MKIKSFFSFVAKECARFMVFAILIVSTVVVAGNLKPGSTEFSSEVLTSDMLNGMLIDWNNIYNAPELGSGGSGSFENIGFVRKSDKELAMRVAQDQTISLFPNSPFPVIIVYAVGGSPRNLSRGVEYFSPLHNNLLVVGGDKYNLTCDEPAFIGRENDAYGIYASYCNEELIISTTASDVDNSQFGDYHLSEYIVNGGVGSGIACHFDGAVGYLDHGDGHDFGFVCKDGKIIEFCERGIGRGFHPGQYTCYE